MIGKRTPPRCTSAVPTCSARGDLAHAVVEHGVAGDPQRPRARWPSQRREKPITSPTSGRLSGGPWRQGVAVTSIGGRPGARAGWSPRVRGPRALPPRRRARAGRHDDAGRGSSARPASSRLSPWCSWVSSTASIGPRSADGDRRAGELARRRAPAEGVPAAGGVEGRIGQQPPASDLEQDGRPADVGDADWSLAVAATGSRRLQRPVEGVVGDLLPALLRAGAGARPSYSLISVTVLAL